MRLINTVCVVYRFIVLVLYVVFICILLSCFNALIRSAGMGEEAGFSLHTAAPLVSQSYAHPHSYLPDHWTSTGSHKDSSSILSLLLINSTSVGGKLSSFPLPLHMKSGRDSSTTGTNTRHGTQTNSVSERTGVKVHSGTPESSQDSSSSVSVEIIQSVQEAIAGTTPPYTTRGTSPSPDTPPSSDTPPTFHSVLNISTLAHRVRQLPERYSVQPQFKWPQPKALRPVQELLVSEWMRELQQILSSLHSLQLTVVFSNQAYTEVLLNWLIAALARASLDLSQLLVVALDHKLHSLLREKEINSILLSQNNFLPDVLREGEFPRVMMARVAIIRLLNHFGYDVINYDTDAILLRDPATLLHRNSQATIIGTFGHFPTDVQRKWGITLCTAMLVVKSSPQTGIYIIYFILFK